MNTTKHVDPFVQSVGNVLELFGVTEIAKQEMIIKEDMVIDKDVTAFVGILGDIRGNVSYSCSIATAKNLVSMMMMGQPVEAIDELSRSALSELSNMFAGNAMTLFAAESTLLDITPPSVIVGEDVFFILSFLKTITVPIGTPVGTIEVNIGLEI